MSTRRDLVLQSVLVPRSPEHGTAAVARWTAQRHGVVGLRMPDAQKNFWNFRQHDPKFFQPRSYVSLRLPDGVVLRKARLRPALRATTMRQAARRCEELPAESRVRVRCMLTYHGDGLVAFVRVTQAEYDRRPAGDVTTLGALVSAYGGARLVSLYETRSPMAKLKKKSPKRKPAAKRKAAPKRKSAAKRVAKRTTKRAATARGRRKNPTPKMIPTAEGLQISPEATRALHKQLARTGHANLAIRTPGGLVSAPVRKGKGWKLTIKGMTPKAFVAQFKRAYRVKPVAVSASG
jgi:hypothetical protein